MSWQGKILRVNLTTGTCLAEPLNTDWAEAYLGQRGLAAKYLYEEIDPAVDPMSPDNKLIIATGPLTGTMAPTGGRSVAVTKGALTNTITSSNTGGQFGAEFKMAGWDLVILEGRAASPVYLAIIDDKAELRDASAHWGRTVWEAEPAIKWELGLPQARVASIGRAGENGVRYACIMNDLDRAFGRSGVGAVMGSKNLKAIVVRGTQGVAVRDPAALMAAVTAARDVLQKNPMGRRLAHSGTIPMLDNTNAYGSLPTRNGQAMQFEGTAKVNVKAMQTKRTSDGKANLKTNKACFACTIGCGRVSEMDPNHFAVKGKAGAERYTRPGGGLEYESVFALGPMVGVDDIEAATYANHVCNEDGMDPISFGGTLSAAMELFQEGVLSLEQTGGLALTFGSAEALVRAVELTAAGEGFGKELALGSKRLCEKYGRPELSMTAKGQEFPGYEPRAMQGMGLAYATSNRGACHLKASPFTSDFETLDLDGKAAIVVDTQDFNSVVDSSGICAFAVNVWKRQTLYDLIAGDLGEAWTTERLVATGERIWNLERMFNLRAGFSRADDTLPKRDLEDPAPSGAGKGRVNELATMLVEYYQLRGWSEDGVPGNATLDRLKI